MKRSEGFTLIEVMISMMVFAIAIAALAGFYIGTARLGESGRNLTQAMNDVRVVAEAMRDLSTGGLAVVTATDWTAWAQANGLRSLQNETVTVTYGNPAADPLQVSVQVAWQEGARPRSASMDTLVTRR